MYAGVAERAGKRNMRIYGLVQDSIVDGPGLRFVCFVQGCLHHCPGCHNPDSHDPAGGTEMTTDEVKLHFSFFDSLDRFEKKMQKL